MRVLGRTERRVVSAILVAALIPLISAFFVGRMIVAQISATAFQPEFGTHLDQALGVYADLVKSIKQGMRSEAEVIALSGGLRSAAASGDARAIEVELERTFSEHPALVSLAVETEDSQVLAKRERARPVDSAAERTLTVRRPLGAEGPDGAAAKFVNVTFATPSGRFEEMEAAQTFAQTYHQFARAHRKEYLDDTYRSALLALLGMTIVLSVAAGVFVVRPVTNRIARLAAATRPVAEGDLSVRVVDHGRDEVADLGRSFNRMLEELDRSRARIDFLRRMSEWQKMARRLAHEIKNPLTPIQLAVEECHRRYEGDDPAYKRIVQTTFEVVEEEIGTLRRLVSEFSSFARLPSAELASADLREFLRDQRDHFAVSETVAPTTPAGDDRALLSHVDVSFETPDDAMPVAMDREMMHRVLTNLVRNAAQALRDGKSRAGPRWGKVRVRAEAEGTSYLLQIDDDGPGIAPEVESTIFDPYVTTKGDGTGLGLSIVKKIVVDHGGTIEVYASPLGGARFEIRLPREGTPASRAALERTAQSGKDSARGSDQVPPSTPRRRMDAPLA